MAGVHIVLQNLIAPGSEPKVQFALADPTNPARFKITLAVDGVKRAFGLTRAAKVLPPTLEQAITIAGTATWTITHGKFKSTDSKVTITATEQDGPRDGSDDGTVVDG